ncbi:MAG: 6,7-dimethyl-8-ribityllumazine synthase [Burkholderiaceae bacterium]|nr:6,7-dimethyl-8-ribityllumazine synthase [Burkholderiaceae bacterium]NDH08763.1 6,7-dimethyl-8-ribityllumazine synthase [Gammaproteobacteria bacterium]
MIKYIKANNAKQQTHAKVAIVVSQFNQFITGRLLEGCLKYLIQHGIHEQNITVVEVPGAIEIPLACQQMITYQQPNVVIGLGCVIRGDTSHYDYVCDQVSQGCQQLAMHHATPVIFGVLTTENEAQALARVGGKHGHKGVEAAESALMMIDILAQIQLVGE